MSPPLELALVDDDEDLRRLLARELRRAGHAVVEHASASALFEQLHDDGPDVVLLDLQLPDASGIDVLRRLRAEGRDVPVVLLTAHGTLDTAIEAMKLGAHDYLTKPCHLAELEVVLQKAHETGRLRERASILKQGLSATGPASELIGRGPAVAELERFVRKVAPTDATVLIRGETGTGKELVARLIHRLSRRAEEPFVVVDCASLHEELLLSELFGHERGSFTGAARQRHGLFEVADGGTIFLDEIGEVSAATQGKLLRVLETSTFRRLGGSKEIAVDVRVLAATNRDLEAAKAQGRFREDLFYRLNIIHVEIPPLRRRREDVPALVSHFAALHRQRTGIAREISAQAMAELCAHDWPGNVRELQHVVESALVLADGAIVDVTDLPAAVTRRREAVAPAAAPAAPPTASSLEMMEARHIARVLEDHSGNRARAAEALAISERSLYRKIKEYGLK